MEKKMLLVFLLLMGSLLICALLYTNYQSNLFKNKEYHDRDEVSELDITIPVLVNTHHTYFEKQINQQIEHFIALESENAKILMQNYYNAFIETGGKKEDFKPIRILIDYEIHSLSPQYLSFSIFRYDTAFCAYNKTLYYNIDLKTGNLVNIKDYLGSNYKEKVLEAINVEIETWSDEKRRMLFENVHFEDLINEYMRFYIDDKQNAVIVFEKYQIAVGASGEIKFFISKS